MPMTNKLKQQAYRHRHYKAMKAMLTARARTSRPVRCSLKLKGCQVIATSPDHIIPLSAGGAFTKDNLRPTCRHCNFSRGADQGNKTKP